MRSRLHIGSPNRHKYVLVAAILLIFILYHSLPTAKSKLDPRAEVTHAENRPRYLHQSTFRVDPDREYEIRLSNALRDIEIAGNKRHDEDATDTIWQIILSAKDHRKDDSYEFQKQNSEWKYQLVNAEWAEKFLTDILALVPDLARLYNSYPHFVQRGDILRYLILWYYGGYYADVDVYPAKSIKTCTSLRPVFKDPLINVNVSLVVGVEIDEPFASPQKMRDWHWARRYGFLQYNFYAPQRFSPLLREIIVRVLSHTKRHVDQSHFLWGGRYNEMTTLEITGPGVFTDAILDVLSDTLPSTHPLVRESLDADAQFGDLVPVESDLPVQRVTWAPFHDIKETLCVEGSEALPGKMLGGICVLPVNAWGNGQRHSGSEDFTSSQACINHRFGGTWKPWKQTWKQYLFG